MDSSSGLELQSFFASGLTLDRTALNYPAGMDAEGESGLVNYSGCVSSWSQLPSWKFREGLSGVVVGMVYSFMCHVLLCALNRWIC